MNWEDCIEDLRRRHPKAPMWIERIVEEAGTTDGDWNIFEAAAHLLVELDEEAQKWHHKYFLLRKIIEEGLERCKGL